MIQRKILQVLVLVVAATVGTQASSAPVELPIADFPGKARFKVTQCSEGGNVEFSASGPITVLSQTGANFNGNGALITHKFGLTCVFTLDLVGTVDDVGNLVGSFTHEFECDNGFSSNGDGGFDGAYKRSNLALDLVGQDEDISGEVCAIAAAFRGKGPPGPAACDAANIAAASKLSKSTLECHSKFAKAPSKDPDGVSRGVCLEKAVASFAKAVDKALEKATTKDATCSYLGLARDASNPILADAAGLAAEIGSGVDNGDSIDRNLRSKLLKKAGLASKKALIAERKNVLKPDAGKLAKVRGKIRQALLDGAQKIIDSATDKGVNYGGASAESIANSVDENVDAAAATFN